MRTTTARCSRSQPGSGTITTLASFDSTNGADPFGGLVEDQSGDLFGTTSEGGASGVGTVFEVQAGSGIITTLASFNGTNGDRPYGNLILDSSGDLFGTTEEGGADDDGTVFEVRAGSGAITTLVSFNGTDGAEPAGALVEDQSGDLFGTTEFGGGFNMGTVFEVQAGSGAVTTLASFDGTNGADPVGGLTMDASGNLFGTTYEGGANGQGLVFEAVLHLQNQTIDFTPPTSPITFTSDETVTLHATGGGSGNPVLFTIDPSSTGTGTISGDTLTITSVGIFVIDANQAGNSSYNAAAQVQETLVVNPASSVVSTSTINALQGISTGSELLATFSVVTGTSLSPSNFTGSINWEDGRRRIRRPLESR